MLDLCWGKIRLVFAGGKWEYPEQTTQVQVESIFLGQKWILLLFAE